MILFHGIWAFYVSREEWKMCLYCFPQSIDHYDDSMQKKRPKNRIQIWGEAIHGIRCIHYTEDWYNERLCLWHTTVFSWMHEVTVNIMEIGSICYKITGLFTQMSWNNRMKTNNTNFCKNKYLILSDILFQCR